ncbi:MAG TPA: hypothetical protein ENK33_12970 [Desulfobacterales bacterium]|nr:hypothetical protein [Desulfobacterales bacterium]
MAVILKYYEGLAYDEIALAMGITAKTIERLPGQARKTLLTSLSLIKE